MDFLLDLLKFPFEASNQNNKFVRFLNFMFRDFPAYLWSKPSIWRLLMLPMLLIYKIFKKF